MRKMARQTLQTTNQHRNCSMQRDSGTSLHRRLGHHARHGTRGRCRHLGAAGCVRVGEAVAVGGGVCGGAGGGGLTHGLRLQRRRDDRVRRVAGDVVGADLAGRAADYALVVEGLVFEAVRAAVVLVSVVGARRAAAAVGDDETRAASSIGYLE